MTTYTIAFGQVLYACVPDGDAAALDRELEDAEQQIGEEFNKDGVVIETGLILTDERPEDERRIVWSGHDLGWLTDSSGESFEYAIRAA